MAFDAHKNLAVSTVATAPSPATSGTSLVVATGEGARFPAAPFNATIWPAGAAPTPANAEIVRVTNVSGDTLTITRAQESTTARTVIVGDKIACSITSKVITDIEAATVPALGTSGQFLKKNSNTSFDLVWADTNKITRGAYASLPASSALAGDTYICTDSLYQFVWTGSVWAASWNGYPANVPPSAGWSWLNQQGATVDATMGALLLTAPFYAAASRHYQRNIAYTPPYTLIAGMTVWNLAIIQQYFGIKVGNSDGSLFHNATTGTDASTVYNIRGAVSTGSASTSRTIPANFCKDIKFKLTNDGVNVVSYFSLVGVNMGWVQLRSDAKVATIDTAAVTLANLASSNPFAPHVLLWDWQELNSVV